VAQKDKQKSQKVKKAPQAKVSNSLSQPWIPMRVGVILIAITSVVMAALTAWQAIPVKGTLNGILWGVFYGGLIWIIFFGNILINRFLRRKR
jgi:hypothetical protein